MGIYEILGPFLHWLLSARMQVEILSLVACFLSLIDLWAFFLHHSPKSLSLHQFILICLLLKPGTRHVLFPGCRSLSVGFPHILPRWASPGWQQEAFHIESSVIEFPCTPLIFPFSVILSVSFFPLPSHPLLTKHSFNGCGITGHPFAARLGTSL